MDWYVANPIAAYRQVMTDPMSETWTLTLAWWISVVELPAMAGLFLLIWRVRRLARARASRRQAGQGGARPEACARQ